MRFRFTIRDLLWLTVVVALAVGWWKNNREMANTITRLQAVPSVSLNNPAVERAMQFDMLEFETPARD